MSRCLNPSSSRRNGRSNRDLNWRAGHTGGALAEAVKRLRVKAHGMTDRTSGGEWDAEIVVKDPP